MRNIIKKSMPKSVNSKKDESIYSGFKPLKEMSDLVIVSEEQYKANRALFFGEPGKKLKLKDSRDVIIARRIGGMAFPLEKAAELLLLSVCSNKRIADSPLSRPVVKTQAYLNMARAYSVHNAIFDFLNPGHKNKDSLAKIRKVNKELYLLLKDEYFVNHVVGLSRSKCEKPENPKFVIGNESIDFEYLSDLIELGYASMRGNLFNKSNSEDDLLCFVDSICMGSVMVTHLRHMGRKASIEYVINLFDASLRQYAEYVFDMLTINEEA